MARIAAHSREELDELAKRDLLAGLETARKALIAAGSQVRPQGSIYHACSSVMASIDMLAYRLTGDREHFWLKQRQGAGPR